VAGGVTQPARAQPMPDYARADILVVILHINAVHVDMSVTVSLAASFVSAAAATPKAAAAARDRHKAALYLRRGFDRGCKLVPFSVQAYGRLGERAMRFLSTLAATAAAGGRVSQSAFLEEALRLVTLAFCKGDGRMCTVERVQLRQEPY
jgi:hypothetical protein